MSECVCVCVCVCVCAHMCILGGECCLDDQAVKILPSLILQILFGAAEVCWVYWGRGYCSIKPLFYFMQSIMKCIISQMKA